MKTKANNRVKLLDLVDRLPEFCTSYFLDNNASIAISTRVAYAQDLMVFFNYLIECHPHFCMKNINEITRDDMKEILPEDINHYISRFIDEDKTDTTKKTAARKRASLSSFFNYLYNTIRIIDRNPVDGAMRVKIPTKDYVEYLNMDEQEIFLNTVFYGSGLTNRQLKLHKRYVARDYALFTMALDTGLRVSEISGIDIKDLDLDECSVIIRRKGDKYQKVYYSDEIRENILEYLREKEVIYGVLTHDAPLFTTIKGERLSVRQMEELVKKYISAALPNKAATISFHKMRSSFAMETYAADNNLLSLQRKLGHSNITATNVYAKASDKQLAESRNLLQKRRSKD